MTKIEERIGTEENVKNEYARENEERMASNMMERRVTTIFEKYAGLRTGEETDRVKHSLPSR